MVNSADGLFIQLTQRELEILKLLAHGSSDREISKKLILSVNTIKWYNRRIYAKLDVCTRTQAVARANQLNLTEIQYPPGKSINSKHDIPSHETEYT